MSKRWDEGEVNTRMRRMHRNMQKKTSTATHSGGRYGGNPCGMGLSPPRVMLPPMLPLPMPPLPPPGGPSPAMDILVAWSSGSKAWSGVRCWLGWGLLG